MKKILEKILVVMVIFVLFSQLVSAYGIIVAVDDPSPEDTSAVDTSAVDTPAIDTSTVDTPDASLLQESTASEESIPTEEIVAPEESTPPEDTVAPEENLPSEDNQPVDNSEDQVVDQTTDSSDPEVTSEEVSQDSSEEYTEESSGDEESAEVVQEDSEEELVVDNDKCKVDADCGDNYECVTGDEGYLTCLEKQPVDCTVNEGDVDNNENGIPDCLEPAEVIQENTEELVPEEIVSEEAGIEPEKEKLVADKVVFGLSGKQALRPAIVNLSNKIVDQKPLILVTGKPKTDVTLFVEKVGDPKAQQIELGKIKIDKESKGQIAVDNFLPVGKYSATLVSSNGLSSNKIDFEVKKTEMDIANIKVVVDKNLKIPPVQPLAKEILKVIEKADSSKRFVADKYIDYKNSLIYSGYRIQAKIDSKDKERKIAYFTYKSTIFASVALTDANDKGEYIDIPVPPYVGRNQKHLLSVYLTDAKNKIMSNSKSLVFIMK